MLHREEIPDTLRTRWRRGRLNLAGDVVRWAWDRAQDVGAIGPTSRRAKAFGSFGDGSVICFPSETIVNPEAIRIGKGTVIAPYVALSAGWGPGQLDLPDGLVTIDYDTCIGCANCVMACPYEARSIVHEAKFAYGDTPIASEAARFDEARIGVSMKCTFCVDRIDEAARTVRVKASGNETKGRGSAQADVMFSLQPDATGTRVVIATDVALAGSVAQYGRAQGVIADVAQAVIDTFAQNLRARIAAQTPAAGAAATQATALPPPARMPEAAPAAVRPRHQMPSTSIGVGNTTM